MIARSVELFAAAVFAAVPASALSGATHFMLVNGTDSPMGSVSIRHFRTGAWQALTVSPGPGGRIAVSFKDEDCAFDIRANLAGKDPVIWSGVNVCEAKAVILHRDGSGAAWVDYD